MMQRTRFTAGLIAMMALLFSVAEGVGASLCAPMPPMAEGVEIAVTQAKGGEATLGESDGMTECGDTSSRDDRNNSELPCPFGPYASSQGCTVAASLPANCDEIQSGTSAGRQMTAFSNPSHENLLVVRLFHPPRA